MSEIERKGGILLSDEEAKNLLLTDSTPGTVAEAISSALETADATGGDEEQEDSSSHHLLNLEHIIHPIIPAETFQTTNEDKLFLSSNNNNSLIDLDEDSGNLVRRVSEDGALLGEGDSDKYNGEGRPFHHHHHHQHHHHNQSYSNAKYLNYPRRRFSTGGEEFNGIGSGGKNCGRRFLSSSSIRLDADGNHVREIHELSSACSPHHLSQSATTRAASMASEGKESSEYYCVNNSDSRRSSVGSDQDNRDKPDNREAHSVSHYKEKPATGSEEPLESSARTGSLFKPSSKVIELPYRPTSASTEGPTTHDRNITSESQRPQHHHHHHHHHRNKESKIPVGIAVAWQRLVTSTSTTPTITSAMTSKGEGNPNKQRSLNSSGSPSKYPARPASVSPLSSKAKSGSTSNLSIINGNSNNNPSASNKASHARESHQPQPISDRPLSVCGGEVGVGGGLVPFGPGSASPLSRPLPSSSVPPNMGFPVGSSYHNPYSLQGYHHHQRSSTPFLDYAYGSGTSVDRTFAIPSPVSSPHHHHHPHSPVFLGNGHSYWGGLDPTVPILTSGIPSNPGASDYLQLSMQQQMHFHHHQHQQHLLASNRQSSLSISSPYNPYLPFMYPHQDTTTSPGPKSPYYDHYFHHQHQQNELLRQQQQQQHQQQQQQLQNQHHSHPHQSGGGGGGSGGNANSPNNDNNNSNNNESNRRASMSGGSSSSSNVGVGFDLLANNNRGTHLDRAVPIEVANSRTSIPLLSPSPTGGIRTTPSPASGGLQADSAEILVGAANTKSICPSTASTTISSSASGTSQSGAGGLVSSSGELSSTYSSCSSASSPSPSFLLIHQQQHPHLFTSSSAALSPKSLTSSTPSPVTVHDFNSGLNVVVGSSSNNNLTTTSSNGSAGSVMLTSRKCATPSPISLTPRPLLSPFGSPFSPSTGNNNNNGNYKDLVWKHDDGVAKISKPIPINGHCGDQQSSAGSSLTTTPTSSPLLHRRSKQLSVPTPLSSPNSQRHDFKRLESLIERRDNESISPLVLIPQHSPATSTTSSMLDGEEIRSILHGDGGECEEKHVNPAFILLKDEEDRESKGNDGDEEEEDVSGREKVGTTMDKEIDSNREEDSTHSTAAVAAVSENNYGNDLFKVKTRHADETKGGLVKAEKVLCGESQPCAMLIKSEVVANKNISKISSCDVNKPNMMDDLPSEIQHDDGGHAEDDNVDDDKIERNVVPESTLPLSSSCKSSYDNDIASYNYVKNEISGSSKTTSEKQSEAKPQQSMSIKHDISFTSGYSSSNDDAEGNHHLNKPKASVKGKLKNNKKEDSPSKGKKKLSPTLKIKGKKIKDPLSGNKKATKKTEGGKGKPLKRIKSKSPVDKASTKAGKPKKSKLKEKPLVDWNGEDEPPEKKKNKKKIKSLLENSNQPGGNVAQLVNDNFALLSSSSSSNNSIKKKEKGRKDNGKLSLKGKNKDQGNKTSSPVKKNPVNAVTHVSSHDKRKNRRGDKGDDAKAEKNGRLMKQATLSKKKLGVKGDSKKANKKGHFLLSPPPPPPQQEHCSKMSTVGRSQHFGANVSGDISGNGNNSSITDDQNNSLTISTSLDSIVSSHPTTDTIYQHHLQQQQPVALILQSSSSLQQGTTLRIPAYVPRSSGSTIIGSSESLSSVMTDELVGDQDNYNGPATLTLHCDVDALAQQQQIYYPQESQIPPAITIQYHHSAPATPLMPLMEATSPLIKPEENSLNLLATVAQEFGSREDLGKRLSIDGSCNNSIIGESPPMSPMRSPGYSVTIQQPQNQPQPPRENKLFQSCIAPTADNSSKGIVSDVVREVVDLYHNDRVSSDKLNSSSKKNDLKVNKKPRKNGEKTSNSIIAKKNKGLKAGKKEKRSISDCGSYSQNLVLLKIPQIQQRPIPSDKSKLEKAKRKSEKKGEKAKEKKSAKLSLLLPTTTPTDNQKKVKGEKSPEKEKVKNVKKKTSSDPEKRSPASLLKPERVSKSPAASSSSSCFYTPPERISAFAKQVIARRDSAVGTGSAPSSPTKSPASNNNPSSPSKGSTFSQDFFPTMKHQQLISPTGHHPHPHSSASSPSVKMPLLTPFDLEQHPEVSKGAPFTFSLAVPPPLVPSISSGSRIAGLSHHHHHSTKIPEQDKEKTDKLVEGSPSCSSSSSSRNIISSKDMVKVKRKKRDRTNSFDDEKGQQPQKKAKKRKHDLPSGEDETATKPMTKKKSKKSESIPSSISPPRTVPKITITSIGKESLSHQYSFSNESIQNPTSFRAFSPLTPPPTAKFPVDLHDSGNNGRGARDLPSLNVKNSTPSSSHLSSPSNLENEEQGDAETTENENENDPNNIWVADPMFAVSAIKLSASNQPSDTSSVGEDVSSLDELDEIERRNQRHKRKSSKRSVGGNDNKPPKLSLYNKNSCQEDSKSQGKDRFLEVKSQLKSFVHFKPNQLKSNKKGQSHIKPCLKAEPVVRSQAGNEDDEDEEVRVVDDEDFELDLEVANITTPNPPKDGNKAKQPSSATSVISGSGKKQSINRNSFSYSSKKHPSSSAAPLLSTKEIMTKVFSRKLSPELGGGRKKQRHQSSSSKKSRRISEVGATVDDEDELLDIDEPTPTIKHSYQHHSAHVSMCAAAAAVIVQSNPTSSTSSQSDVLTSSSQMATATASPSKQTPKKRSARSSTTSSSASTKSSGRGYRGQSAFTTAFANAVAGTSNEKDETLSPGKVELGSVAELVDEMRILTEIQGLFYTGRLNALQPPDVYGVTLDNERGAPPHLIFSAEEVLEKCLREKKPSTLTSGLRICAYWSPQYSGLYPGRVSTTDFNPKFDPEEDLVPIEFDDGDTGMIKLKEIRALSANHPVREYDPNPLLTLEKKHRRRRHSSATGTSGGCTGDHEEPDCGEPYCAKIGKLQDEEDDDDEDDDHPTVGRGGGHSKMLYWTWSGLGYKRPKNKKNKNKEFFHGIQRGDEVLNVGDAALFISTGNERPFIGRVERFWECKGKKMVNVRWFYHPEEVKASAKRLSNLKYPGALFESPHIDENDVQTIAKKCDVLPFAEFKQRISTTSSGSPRLAKLSLKSSAKPRDMYYVAGFYDPYTYNLKIKDLK